MKISQLVQQVEMLEAHRPRGLDDHVIGHLNHVIFEMSRHRLQMPDIEQNLTGNANQIRDSLRDFDRNIDLMLTKLRDQIQLLESGYMVNSSRLYEEIMTTETAEDILNRQIALSPTSRAFIQSRVQAHSHWHYTGLIIRPGRESWIENMVACDPLYLVDTAHPLLDHAKSLFNPMYQRRLRYNAIDEMRDPGVMRCLPDNQIGFCLAYNFFHFKPVEIIRAYLTEIYTKLCPGGVLAMTYNDCDRFNAVVLAENNYTCYTPGRLIRSLCESLGFSIEYAFDVTDETVWMEMSKPGHRTSLRGGQSLAEIVAKPK